MRMLAYGVIGDLVNEYMCMSESTYLESMYRFCKAVVQVFAGEYLREQNATNIVRLLSTMSQEAFLVCLVASTACTMNGRNDHLHGKGSTSAMRKGARSYLR
jgi:hypothetical protein